MPGPGLGGSHSGVLAVFKACSTGLTYLGNDWYNGHDLPRCMQLLSLVGRDVMGVKQPQAQIDPLVWQLRHGEATLGVLHFICSFGS